ncbi:MAG TPA: hypothetical protein VIH16_03830 [Bellilinea sp.]
MRSVKRWSRFYADGYNLSSEVGTIGQLKWEYDAELFAALDWEVQGSLPDQVNLGAGPVNGLFSQETGGTLQAVLVPGIDRYVMVPVGFLAPPAMGDPVYCARLLQTEGKLTPGAGMMTGSWNFPQASILGGWNYTKPWGVLLNPLISRTAVNAAAGVDGGAASSAGGFMAYQVMAGAGVGSVVIKVQDSADNAAWADLALATISVASTAIPTAGQVQIPITATVRRYLRWQIVFTGMTGVTFALAFVRG